MTDPGGNRPARFPRGPYTVRAPPDVRGEFVDRNTFYEIGSDGWRWREDRSYEGGKTWAEGIGFIEAGRK